MVYFTTVFEVSDLNPYNLKYKSSKVYPRTGHEGPEGE